MPFAVGSRARLVLLGLALACGACLSQAQAAQNENEWPQFRGNAGHTGVSPDDSIKPPFKLLWSYRTDGDTTNDAMAGVTVAGRKVFVPSANTGSILALDADTGRFQWEFKDSHLSTDPSTYYEGRLYLWMRGGTNQVVALDAADGKLIWQKTFGKARVGGRKRAAFSISNGWIYLVEREAEPAVLAIDAKSGETQWRTPLGTEDGLIPLAPSVAGGMVFVATRDGFEPSRKLVGATVALDAATGKELWRKKGVYPFKAMPTDGEVLACAPGYSPAPMDTFRLLDAKTGEALWTHPEKTAYPQATLLPDRVLIHPNGPRFLAVDRKTGQTLWKFASGPASGCCAPVSAGGYAYFGTGCPYGSDSESVAAWSHVGVTETKSLSEKGQACTLHAVDLKNGKSVWQFTAGNNICGDIALAYGRIYCDSRDGQVYCFKPVPEGEPWDPETKDAGPNAPAEEVKRLLAAPLDAPRPGKDWPMYGGTPERAGLDGMTLNAPLAPAWTYATGGRVCVAAAIRDGRVYAGSDSGKLFALDATSGQKLWEFQTGAQIRCSPAVAGGMVYGGSDDGSFYALDAASGEKKWVFACGGPIQAAPAVVGGAVIFGANDHHTYLLDRSSGKKLWSVRDWSYSHQAAPVVHGETVFVASWIDWLRALDLSTGQERWRSYAPVTLEALALHEEKLYLRTPYYVMEYEPASGKRLRMGNASCGFGGLGFLPGLLVQSGVQGQYGTSGAAPLDLAAPGRDPKPYKTLEEVRWLSNKPWPGAERLESMGTPLGLGDKVCIAAISGEVALIAPDGKKVWTAKLGGTCHASPVAADGLLVVGGDDGKLYGFRESQGAKNAP